jgi:hypothetical protein
MQPEQALDLWPETYQLSRTFRRRGRSLAPVYATGLRTGSKGHAPNLLRSVVADGNASARFFRWLRPILKSHTGLRGPKDPGLEARWSVPQS